MDKFKTTLGDAIAAKTGSPNHEVDWRADMRANDIARRPPPPQSYNPPPSTQRPASQGGPDRGYIEQPAERIPTAVMPLVMLRRTPVPPPDSPPATLPVAPPEAAEMPKAKRARRTYSDEFRAQMMAEALRLGPGGQAITARKHRIDQSILSLWLKNAKKRGALPPASGVSSVRTLVSAPASSPNGGPVSVGADTLPAMPTISIPGLPEYIRAIVREEVKAELRRRLSGD